MPGNLLGTLFPVIIVPYPGTNGMKPHMEGKHCRGNRTEDDKVNRKAYGFGESNAWNQCKGDVFEEYGEKEKH